MKRKEENRKGKSGVSLNVTGMEWTLEGRLVDLVVEVYYQLLRKN